MSNVDWDSKTVIGKKSKAPAVTRTESELNYKKTSSANKSHAAAAGPDHQRIAKLDRENEVAPPPKVAPSVGKAIATARGELKLTQKDLAQKINEKPSVLQDYESGKAVPNVQILSKMERALGVKLRGNDIGKKLAPRGAEKK